MQIGGKELTITPAPFADAMALQKAIGRSLKGSKIDLSGIDADIVGRDAEGNIDLSTLRLDKANGMIQTIANLILNVSTSDEIEECLFKCASRAVIGGEKVTLEYFEKVENRKNYFPIMMEIIKTNVGPFFGDLVSLLGGIQEKMADFLKQK